MRITIDGSADEGREDSGAEAEGAGLKGRGVMENDNRLTADEILDEIASERSGIDIRNLRAALEAMRKERDGVINKIGNYCEYTCRDTFHCERCFLKHSGLIRGEKGGE